MAVIYDSLLLVNDSIINGETEITDYVKCLRGTLLMVLLVISIILFNSIAYKMTKRLTKNQIVHIWAFTIILVTWADIYVDEKTGGYWYFQKGIEWHNFLVYTLLIPPVNVIFLNWFPFNANRLKIMRYFVYWIIFITVYELTSLLPQPWGFFHYGWWNMLYSVICDPILLGILLVYYKWIGKIEKSKPSKK